MAFSLNSPEHPAEEFPDIDIRGTREFFHSRVAEACPSCMRSIYQTCQLETWWKQKEVKVDF